MSLPIGIRPPSFFQRGLMSYILYHLELAWAFVRGQDEALYGMDMSRSGLFLSFTAILTVEPIRFLYAALFGHLVPDICCSAKGDWDFMGWSFCSIGAWGPMVFWVFCTVFGYRDRLLPLIISSNWISVVILMIVLLPGALITPDFVGRRDRRDGDAGDLWLHSLDVIPPLSLRARLPAQHGCWSIHPDLCFGVVVDHGDRPPERPGWPPDRRFHFFCSAFCVALPWGLGDDKISLLRIVRPVSDKGRPGAPQGHRRDGRGLRESR